MRSKGAGYHGVCASSGSFALTAALLAGAPVLRVRPVDYAAGRCSAGPARCRARPVPGQCRASAVPAATFGPAALGHGPRIPPRLVLQLTVRALRVSPPELPFTSARGLGSPLRTPVCTGLTPAHACLHWAHPSARLPALGSVCMRARRPVVVCLFVSYALVCLFVCSCSLMANICSDEQKRALLLELVRASPMGSPRPHLHQDWAHPAHICNGTGLDLATSVPGLGPPRPHLCKDGAHPAHVCTGTEPGFTLCRAVSRRSR